ncbi:hypothetical protein PEPS_18750 [Persicobacter psychrovividus]|uniref:IPExxxVDY family protein n=2 Tax=Persicobacter psychrovividus TaxID=387638 RepID=A0ABM7VFG5_9BACT|nr:hypothetical protein PEPS_18750 [Persicobacter psychrovividus]
MGIVAPMRAYKLVWYLNQAMRIDFAKQAECEIHPFNRAAIKISYYQYEAPYGNFRLIENRAVVNPKDEIHYLIPELKEFDFLLYVQGEMHQDYFERLRNGLKQLTIVNYFKVFDVERIATKENLIF